MCIVSLGINNYVFIVFIIRISRRQTTQEVVIMERSLQIKVIALLAFVFGNTAIVVLLAEASPLARLAVTRAVG